MNLRRLHQEIWLSPYYRLHPGRIIRLLMTKWRLRQQRVESAEDWLVRFGIAPDKVLSEFRAWRIMLEEMVAAVAEAPGDHGGIGMEDGLILYSLVRTLTPTYAIETGVAAGVSTAFLCAALIDNARGTLFSIELPPETVEGIRQTDGALLAWPTCSAGWAIPPQIRDTIGDRHQLVFEDVATALPRLAKQLPFVDLFLHDDLHVPDHMLWEYQLIWPVLRSGGVLASDDVNEGWLEFCRKLKLTRSALRNLNRFAAVRKPGGSESCESQFSTIS